MYRGLVPEKLIKAMSAWAEKLESETAAVH